MQFNQLWLRAVYLFFGLVLMLLLVANVYDVPELNVGRYFYVHAEEDAVGAASSPGDGERRRLHSPSDAAGSQPPRYTTTDPAAGITTQQDLGTGGGGGGATKRSKKPEDKRRLTDDPM